MFAVLEIIGFINIFGIAIYRWMLFPSLSTEIRNRLQELGQPIQFSLFGSTYYKVKRLNRDLQDPTISRLLEETHGFIIYAIFSFVFLAVMVIFDGLLNN